VSVGVAYSVYEFVWHMQWECVCACRCVDAYVCDVWMSAHVVHCVDSFYTVPSRETLQHIRRFIAVLIVNITYIWFYRDPILPTNCSSWMPCRSLSRSTPR
jgi:hypothetical protein